MLNSETSLVYRQPRLLKSTKNVEPVFLQVIKQNESMWDGPLSRINLTKHPIVLKPTDTTPTHSAPYLAGPMQRDSSAKVDKSDVLQAWLNRP